MSSENKNNFINLNQAKSSQYPKSIQKKQVSKLLGTFFESRILIYMTSIVSCQSSVGLLLIVLLLPILCMQIIHIVSVVIRRPFTSWLDCLESVLVEFSLISYAISVVCAHVGRQNLTVDSAVIFLLLLTIAVQAIVAIKELIVCIITLFSKKPPAKIVVATAPKTKKAQISALIPPLNLTKVIKRPQRQPAKVHPEIVHHSPTITSQSITSTRLFPECSNKQKLGKHYPIKLRVQAKAL